MDAGQRLWGTLLTVNADGERAARIICRDANGPGLLQGP
jgi:hypothetical protein